MMILYGLALLAAFIFGVYIGRASMMPPPAPPRTSEGFDEGPVL